MSGVNATSSIYLSLNAEAGAPEWVMLFPAGEGGVVTTVDGRGPYRAANLTALAEASLQAAGGKLAIDECHSTDLAAPKGLPAPARGWVVAAEARDDGLWGRVDWTDIGRDLVAGHAYRGISPVFAHDPKGNVLRFLRASLTNTPNLRGIAALHSEGVPMDLTKLREMLGLAADADEAAILAAIRALKDKPALQSALAPIAKAAGLKDDADVTAIATAVTTLATRAGQDQAAVITALQTELATVSTTLATLQSDGAKARATTYVDGEIARGRVGVKPLRDHYIAMHAADAARVEKEIGAMPIIGPSGARVDPPATKDGKIALNSEQLHTCKLLGLDPEAYRKTLEAEQAEQAA
ncbi:phage protease [Xanthobacteraceae bacterium Astr-EGSB]|jgi:phage I-like protein|uniref:phage protease n=1 Tax=Astrobacterium formosum TaxID=3069710 RepID=UPI0027B45EDB|nr:phage protease [Xanthobacteraceae bacterium Astr-EGSB]